MHRYPFVSGVVFLALALTLVSCSSRNLRPGFKAASSPLKREWVYPVEPISSSLATRGMEYISPVIDGSVLLFGSTRAGLIALYPKLLRERWRISMDSGVVSPITISDQTAYFVDGEGNLEAVSTENGKKIWSYALRNPVASRPTVLGKDLYLTTSDDALISIDALSGKWQWHYRRRNTSGPTIHGATSPVVIGDAVWAGFSDGALVALTRKEGKVMWEKQLNSNRLFADLGQEFAVMGEKVAVGGYDNSVYLLNSKSGATLWQKDHLGGSRGLRIRDGKVFSASSTGVVYAMAEGSGEVLWSFELDHAVPAGITALERHLVVASSSRYLYLLELNTGKLVDRWDVGYESGFAGPMTYDEKTRLGYVLSRGGNLYSFSYEQFK